MSILAEPAAPRTVDLSGLNSQQRKAVCHDRGPLLVIAGAGSGKTRVLTTRIAHLVTERGVDPASVLAITFTNKAAREMKERLKTMLGAATLGQMRVATFHSAFLRVLRRYPEAVGLRDGFTIFDTDDCTKLVENVTEDVGYDPKTVKPRGTLGAISAAKNALISPAVLSRAASGRIAHAHAHIYGAYQLALLRQNAVDFDDILVHTVALFTGHADVLTSYQDRWQHILVDEYQDTNIAQNKIVRLLGARHRNVTVVGDPDQYLLPDTPVTTPAGPVPISTLTSGSQVSGTGGGGPLIGTVASVHEGHYSGPVVSVTAGDRKIVGTPHHIIPARFLAQQGTRIIYLMYRADRGYRIGRTSGIRARGDRRSGPQSVPGYIVRLAQEHGDKLWVLHSCTSEEESVYWESYYAAQYGIPKDCFHANGRGELALSGMTLARLFASIDTTTRAKQLMEDLNIHPDFPHHMSMGG